MCVWFFAFVVLFWLDSFFLIFPRSSVTVQDAIKLKKKGLLNRRDDLSRKRPSFWVSGMRSVLMTKKAIPSVVTRIVQILNRSYQMGNTWQTPRIYFRRQMSQMVAMKLLPKSKMDCKSAHCHYEVLLRAVRKDCSFWLSGK